MNNLTRRYGKRFLELNSYEITTRLYEDIVIGVFPFGNKLVEERLSEVYGTKRHVLRDAFSQLEELGFVERIPNRGVYVREPHPKEVRELYKMRALLEQHATRETPLPAPLKTTEKLRQIQDDHSIAIRSLNFRNVLHLNTEFHRVQFSACRNQTLVSAIEYYATRTHLITSMKFSDSAVMETVISQHEAIIEAMKNDSHSVLEACVERHFDIERVNQYERQYKLRHDGTSAILGEDRPHPGRIRLSR